MSNNQQREYRTSNGEVKVQLTFGDNKVTIEDGDKRTIGLDNAQGLWLADQLHEQFGGGPKKDVQRERILLFSEAVNGKSVRDMQSDLLRVAYREMELAESKRGPINLIINSPGGQCVHGFALMDTIEFVRGLGVPVVGIVNGMAYSMGGVILQACTRRLMFRHARLMIHQISSASSGKLEEMEANMDEYANTNRRVAEVFAEHNTAGRKDVDFWVSYMKGQDKYLSPSEAMDMGIIDGVYRPIDQFEIPGIMPPKSTKEAADAATTADKKSESA